MLSKKQKFLMAVLGTLSILAALVAAVPFRSFPGLNKIENILELEVLVKVAGAALVLLLSVYPIVKKYKLVKNNHEYSKTVLVMSYLPSVLYILGLIVNVVYTLSFDFTAVAMLPVLSEKVIAVAVAIFAVLFVFGIYCLFRLYNFIIKLDGFGNVCIDLCGLLVLVCFVLIQNRIATAYNAGYQHLEEYYLGNPLLFVIYILLIIALGLSRKHVKRLIKKNEVLVFYSESADAKKRLKQIEYNRAYNDTLDDYEAYFDENQEAIESKAVEEVYEVAEEEEVTPLAEVSEKPAVEVQSIVIEENDEEVTPVAMPTVEVVDSEEVKQVETKKAEVKEAIEKAKANLTAVSSQKEANEAKKAELKARQEAYEASLASQKEVVEVATVEEAAPAVRKVDKIVPSFGKMVDYANSFSDHEGFKVVSNAKGNLHKFYIGKKMYLVMQATNSDYRISFITSPEKFVEYLKSRPGQLTAPKNLKDKNWVRLVNKGKEEAKFMRQVIKQAVLTAEKQIADEAAKKAEERKAKAKERAAAKAAQKAAEKEAK